MTQRTRDHLTLELFCDEVPSPVAPNPGALDLDTQIREALSEALRHSELDRYQVAAEMSRLTGRQISKYMLDAYTAESRAEHNFPLQYAAAFEQATGSYCLTNLLAKTRGCQVLVGEEALLAEYGRLEQAEREARELKKALQKRIGGDR